MCGILGHVGPRPLAPILLEGLRRLEYRGYDSAGLAAFDPHGELQITKVDGRVEDLARAAARRPVAGAAGIGHTRWATHGEPSQRNAHPHADQDATIVMAHNGVIENYATLKQQLQQSGCPFLSSTDSEVIAHLLARSLRAEQQREQKHEQQAETGGRGSSGSDGRMDIEIPLRATQATLAQLQGTYGLVILFRDYPGLLVAARLGSPLVVGVGDGEHFVASDASALAGWTDRIVYLADHQLAAITQDNLHVAHRGQGRVDHRVETLQIESNQVQLGDCPHYMLKEIIEQPRSLNDTMRGRLDEENATAVFGGLNMSAEQLRGVKRILLTACGTSWHAALVGEYIIEEVAQIPVEVEYASELRYRNPPMEDGTLVFAITQSGETADTLAALREMKRKGYPTQAICNVVGSTIAQEAGGGIYLHAGPEIGVASTKAFTSQCLVLTLLALYFGRLRHISYSRGRHLIEQIQRLPALVEKTLETNDEVRRVAARYFNASNVLYMGRQFNFPVALEGALKLKEISYIHAEGYPAAEMKHGPIALVDENTPSVFIMPRGFVYEKVMANLEEIKARGGPVIAIAEEGDRRVQDLADDVIYVPKVEEFLQPLVTIIPLQLLSYHIAVLRGCDVDKPRNLAKSVTVE